MKKKITVFIEYKIKKSALQMYELLMEKVHAQLLQDGMQNIQWLEAIDQNNLFVESFETDDVQAYHQIKKLRKDENHPIYGKLLSLLEGGAERFHCWAFEQKMTGEHHE